MEFNKTWQEARSQRPLPSLCFSGRSEKQDSRPGLWLADIFSTSSLKPLNGIQWHLIGNKISTSSTKFLFFGRIGYTRWSPWPLFGRDIFDFSSETNSTNLTGSKISTSSTKFVLFGPIGKTRWPPWPLIGRDISTSPLNGIQRNFGREEARSQRPLPMVCFSGRSDKQDGRPGLCLAETFSTSPLKLIQQTWQEARSQRPLPSLCFLGRSEKQDCRPDLWLAETFRLLPWTEFNETWVERKQDLNVVYQVCAFRADRKNKMAAMASEFLRHFRDSSENTERNAMQLDRKQDLNVLYQNSVFRVDQKNNGNPGLWLTETFSTSPLKLLNGIVRNLTGSKISTSYTNFWAFFVGLIRNKKKKRWLPWPLIGWDIFYFSSETAERNSTKLDRN